MLNRHFSLVAITYKTLQRTPKGLMNPYHDYIRALAASLTTAKELPLGGFPPCPGPRPAADAPAALLFSPHPDDECITGLLPLRLMREAGWRIINIPVTHGSRAERRAERHDELRRACAFLGWEWAERLPDGSFIFQSLEKMGGDFPIVGKENTHLFQSLEKEEVITLLTRTRPAAIFVPHAADGNTRHIATHHLVMAALAAMPTALDCQLIETEFWGAMPDPNLMVEGDVTLVADLVAATSFHIKEVQRNPYHRLLPAWLLDNVRRGAELVGGQGQAAPDFLFATLYRHRHWTGGQLKNQRTAPAFCALTDNPRELFPGH
jgi:N-acetylglucosamine malate deacetylase 1